MKRRFTRIPVKFEAELVSDGIRHKGIIKNLSENGIYMEIAPATSVTVFNPGTRLELEFRLPSTKIPGNQEKSGEALKLYCEVKSFSKTSSNSLTNQLGLEFLEFSPAYEEFFKSIYIKYMAIL